jgi:hypothetical protein
MSMNFANLQQAQLLQQAADAAAQRAYNRSRLNLESEQLALNKAQQEWTRTFQESQLTGMYGGQWTFPARQFFTQEFGGWETPFQGQTNLALEAQRNQQAAQYAQMFGSWYRPGTQPGPGATTLAQQQQAFAQGAAQFGQQRDLFREALAAQQ